MTHVRPLLALAIVALGLAAGSAFAHLLEMPNKLQLGPQAWLLVQSTLYDGWGWKLALVELAALIALVLAAWQASGTARRTLIAAMLLLVAAEALVWFFWINPVNATVESWAAEVPMAEWQALRSRWEWGHVARFALLTAALGLTASAGVRSRLDGESRSSGKAPGEPFGSRAAGAH